jgi:hypothetical protein
MKSWLCSRISSSRGSVSMMLLQHSRGVEWGERKEERGERREERVRVRVRVSYDDQQWSGFSYLHNTAFIVLLYM